MTDAETEDLARRFIRVWSAGNLAFLRGVSLYEVADGRIVAERGVADVLGLMRQLGAV